MSIRSANRRVVVTGLGLVTPLGISVQENWQSLLDGKCNIKPLNSEEYKNLPCRIASQVDKEKLNEHMLTNQILKRSDLKAMSLANIFALASAEQAVRDSGWRAENEEAECRAGTSMAIGMAGLIEISEAAVALNRDSARGFKLISPYFVPKILSNLSSGLISIKYRLKGPNHCVTTACAAGSHAILDACSFIKNDQADVMVCGATEACIHPVSVAGFSRMRALATKFNSNPESASRPFDVDRDGFVMSEGSGCLILEELDHAQKRNAKIYAEILGTGLNADANHITNPTGDGAYRCMKMAIEQSNLKPDQIDFINAHATSTPVGDIAEIAAVKRLFASFNSKPANPVYVSSLKSSLGHLLGAAGAVETILTILACKHKVIPPMINVNQLDPELKLNEADFLKILLNEKQELTNRKRIIALKNSFGFGGTNASICLSNYIHEQSN